MRSIRFSLIIYFLILVAGTLGVVSLLAFQTSADVLREKDLRTIELIDAQYHTSKKSLLQSLDRRLFRQSQTLASMARSTFYHYEGLYPLGALGAAVMPQGHLCVPLWVAEAHHRHLVVRLYRMRPLDVVFDSPDDVVLREKGAEEYFQISYAPRGAIIRRSASLEQEQATFDPKVLGSADNNFLGDFDDVVLKSGKKLRRITIRVSVTRFRRARTFPRRFTPVDGKRTPSLIVPTDKPSPLVPDIIVQYAADTTTLAKQIDDLRDIRDARVALMQKETAETLKSVRERLLWIGLFCFIGILVGGYTIVRLGLAPLRRLSEAVSKVSEKDFQLKIDARRVPEELSPIVTRLTTTLRQLQKAFEHEKQATADLSHELRTPLAALLTTLEVAARKQRSPEEYRELLEDCRTSTQDMLLLVERLLVLARLDASADRANLSLCDVAQLTHQCANMVMPLADVRGIRLQVHVPETLNIRTDPKKVREVLTNLLHNAIEYNKPHGSVDVELRRDNGNCIIEVRDTGIGIDENAVEHLFERFYRVDPSRHADTPHAGLGLSIVKGCVELLEGSISVKSSPEGSVFRVCIPAGPEDSEAITAQRFPTHGQVAR